MENCNGKSLVVIFGGNVIFDIIEAPAFKKYSMYTLGLGLHKIGSLSLSLSSQEDRKYDILNP